MLKRFSHMLTCILMFSFGSLQAQEAPDAEAPNIWDLSPEILEAREGVYDFGEADPLIQEWLRFRRNQQIKQPLDADVDKALRESEIARQVLPDVLKEIESLIETQFHQHLISGATVVTGEPDTPYDWLYHMVLDAKNMLNGPPDAEVRVFVIGGGADGFNAYTWGQFDVVFFEGLLKAMSTTYDDADHIKARFKAYVEQVMASENPPSKEWAEKFLENQTRLETRQVGGHEIFHGRGDHLRNRLHLTVLMNAHAQNLIPSPDDPNSEEVLEEIESRKTEIQDAMRSAARSLLPHAGRQMSEPLVDALVDAIERATQRVRQRFDPEVIDQERQRFQRAIRGLPSDAAVENSKEAIKKFQEDLQRLSRAQEAGCDNAGALVTQHPKASVMAYRRFTGGSQETLDTAIANMERTFQTFAREGMLAEFGTSSDSTHPRSLARAWHMLNFPSTQMYRVLSDPLMTTVLDYIAITETLMKMDGKIGSRGRWELTEHGVMIANRQKLAEFADKLATWIAEAVASDFLDSSRGELYAFPHVLEVLSDYLGSPKPGVVLDPTDEAVQRSLALREEMSRSNRLGSKLIVALEEAAKSDQAKEMKVGKVIEGAIKLVGDLIPNQKGFRTVGMRELVKAYANACSGGGSN